MFGRLIATLVMAAVVASIGVVTVVHAQTASPSPSPSPSPVMEDDDTPSGAPSTGGGYYSW
jgi:hypothetical protein